MHGRVKKFFSKQHFDKGDADIDSGPLGLQDFQHAGGKGLFGG